MTERDVRLGTVQETLLIPLYGRAVENRKSEAVLRDPVAEELVAAIDYDFARFDGLPMLLGTVLRTTLFDRWAAAFLAEHPTGTMVEIGTGLNTRHERTDNGRARRFDLDLPDVIELPHLLHRHPTPHDDRRVGDGPGMGGHRHRALRRPIPFRHRSRPSLPTGSRRPGRHRPARRPLPRLPAGQGQAPIGAQHREAAVTAAAGKDHQHGRQ
ncbi:class I SAM-dependent methyltransferase [Streptomyces sp. ADMS]|uniref:class I SAM-dependent methyltransferase n=1 Tax=Streptomyces sp. ADMS TaxID=3071415 RepID=UPI003991DB5C